MSDPFSHVAGLPSVHEAVEEARESVDRLLGHRILRRQSAEVSAESALRGARASAALEGVSAPLEEVRSALVNDPFVLGALRVSEAIGSLAGVWRNAPRQALARLHAIAASDSVAADDLGRPRSGPDARDPLSLGPAPSPATVAARLSSLSDLLTAPTAAPALVVAAITQGELLALRPFGWGDGIVARAAVRLTLIDRGLDPKSLVAPEVGHVELGSAYHAAITAMHRALRREWRNGYGTARRRPYWALETPWRYASHLREDEPNDRVWPKMNVQPKRTTLP